MTFDQDECFLDGSDAGLTALPNLQICKTSTVKFNTANCGQPPPPPPPPPRQVYLNILLDMNSTVTGTTASRAPGPGPCAYEWR